MSHRRLARACAWCGLWALAAAACSSGDQPSTNEPTITAVPSTSAEPFPTSAAPTSATSPPTTASARTIEVTFADGQVVGGVRRETVRLGERVRLRVTSDVADEVHVHTYDAKAAVAAGQTAELEVTGTIPGRHEVELENRRKQLLTLEVR